MNIDNLILNQLKEIKSMMAASAQENQSVQKVDYGVCIVTADWRLSPAGEGLQENELVLQGGPWNFVGECRQEDELLVIENASVIRYWGTTRGILQLAGDGPTTKTQLVPYGLIKINKSNVVELIPCDASRWKGKLLSPGETDQGSNGSGSGND